MTTAEKLLTAEEFADLPDSGRPCELVRGRTVWMNPPKPTHGFVCGNIARLIGNHVVRRRLGRILSNDTGVITTRDPDSVRGPDVAFFSFQRLPRGPLPEKYPDVAPEVVFEVLSPDDRWSKILEKVAEYLHAGVLAVCVVDPERQKVHIYRNEREAKILSKDEKLQLPEVFARFSVRVREFFETLT
jgi:Uma2 family endonuclease